MNTIAKEWNNVQNHIDAQDESPESPVLSPEEAIKVALEYTDYEFDGGGTCFQTGNRDLFFYNRKDGSCLSVKIAVPST